MTRTRKFFPLILLLSCAASAAAQGGDTLFSKPFVVPSVRAGARAAALGSAFVADAHDVSVMTWNPAALAFLRRTDVVFNHQQEQYIKGAEESIAIPIPLHRREVAAVALSIGHVGYVGDKSATPYRALQYGFSAAYARELLPTLSVGAGFQARRSKSDASSKWSYAGSLGLFYAPAPEVSYGAMFGDVGEGVEYLDNKGTTIVRPAFSPRTLHIGAELRYPGESPDPELIVSVANEKVFGESGIYYKGGVEFYPWYFLALRGGYIVAPNTSTARFGWGFRSHRLALDFSISPSKQTDQAVQITLSVDFWQRRLVVR